MAEYLTGSDPQPFSPQAAAEALDALIVRVSDPEHGEGAVFLTGTGPPISVFSSAVRVSDPPELCIELIGQPLMADIGPDRVVFHNIPSNGRPSDDLTRRLELTRDGEVIYHRAGYSTRPPTDADLDKENYSRLQLTGKLGGIFPTRHSHQVKIAVFEDTNQPDGTIQATLRELWASPTLAKQIVQQRQASSLPFEPGMQVSVTYSRNIYGNGERQGQPFLKVVDLGFPQPKLPQGGI